MTLHTSLAFIAAVVFAFVCGAVFFSKKAKPDQQTLKNKLIYDLFWLKVGLDDVRSKIDQTAAGACKERAEAGWKQANDIYVAAVADLAGKADSVEHRLKEMLPAYQGLANARAHLEEIDRDDWDRDPKGCHGNHP